MQQGTRTATRRPRGAIEYPPAYRWEPGPPLTLGQKIGVSLAVVVGIYALAALIAALVVGL